MGKILSISSSGVSIEPEKKALLIDGPSFNDYVYDNGVEHVVIQVTPFEKQSSQSIISETKISTSESDYDVFLYIIDKEYIRYAYIAPAKEISNQKIYLNADASNMFYIPYGFSSITGVQYLDFSLVKTIEDFIECDEGGPDIVGDIYFNFRKMESAARLINGSLLSGNIKIVLPNTMKIGIVSTLFVNIQIYGNVFIVDANAEIIRNAFITFNSAMDNCIGTAIFIDYTAGHEDGAQALVDLISGSTIQYNGQVLLGQEVII